MVFQDFLSFLVFLETSEVAGPGPNPREIDISFGADGPLAPRRSAPMTWTWSTTRILSAYNFDGF